MKMLSRWVPPVLLAAACGWSPAAQHSVRYGGAMQTLVRVTEVAAHEAASLRHLQERMPGQKVTAWKLNNGPTVFLSGRMYIRFKPATPVAAQRQLGKQLHAGKVQPMGAVGELWDVQDNLFEALDAAARDPGVLLAEPELAFPVEQRWVPPDPLFPHQWHLESTGQEGSVGEADVNATTAWDVTRGTPDVMVAIIDDGVEMDHPDFDPCRMVAGPDVFSGDADPNPGRLGMHGTSCAGVAAAGANNHTGGSGICPQCRVMAIRLLGTQGSAAEVAIAASETRYIFDTSFAQAVHAAVEGGASILSNSWGPTTAIAPISAVARDAIDHAVLAGRGGRGAVVLFAAGNTAADMHGDGYVNHPPVVAVSALNDHARLAGYSSFGDAIDVTAPSAGWPGDGSTTTGIWTTDRSGMLGYNPGSVTLGDRTGNYTNSFSGTSSATPLVAGILGLMFSVDPTLTGEQAVALLKETAMKVDPLGGAYDSTGHSRKYGAGKVDAAAAVAAVLARRTASSVGVPCTTGCGAGFSCEPGGRFDDHCTIGCMQSQDCPAGYSCLASASAEHPGSLVCVRDSTCPLEKELCGDGVDNNHNQQVDEGCPRDCVTGTPEGECNGNTWTACEEGVALAGDCTGSSVGCRMSTTGFAACVGCGDLVEWQYACNGNVLQGCVGGVLTSFTCPEACGDYGDGTGPRCGCAGGLSDLRCASGNTLEVCAGGVTDRTSCPGTCSDQLGCECPGLLPFPTTTCRDNTVVYCNAFSGTVVDQHCENGCSTDDAGAHCTCPSGASDSNPVCQQGTLKQCESSSGRTLETACAFGCGDGGTACACEPLLADGARCGDAGYLSCDPVNGATRAQSCRNGCDAEGRWCLCDPSHCDGNTLVTCDPASGQDQAQECTLACVEEIGYAHCLCPDGYMSRCDQNELLYCGSLGPVRQDCGAASCGLSTGFQAACGCPGLSMAGECWGSSLFYCSYGTAMYSECAGGCVLDAMGFARCREDCGLTRADEEQYCAQGFWASCTREFPQAGLASCSSLGMSCEMDDAGPRCRDADGGYFWAGGVVHDPLPGTTQSLFPWCACSSVDTSRGLPWMVLGLAAWRVRRRR